MTLGVQLYNIIDMGGARIPERTAESILEEIGVFLFVAHNEGSGSELNTVEIANLLDERIIDFLGINP